ncbi:MAG: VanZ family protein [Candidatus Omnitrophica bacterium]|nr:VanZ family protein [Candidatus Omnitrophota bacterium]
MKSRSLNYWIPVYCFAGAITALSSIPGSADLSAFPQSDKLIHILEYIPLGMAASWACFRSRPKTPWSIIIAVAVAGCLAFGIIDEFRQLGVLGREADPVDVGFDVIGAFLGAMVMYVSVLARLRKS